MLKVLRGRRARRQHAAMLCAAVVARAREPVFFRDFAVPDTIDGRFDLVALHAWFLLDNFRTQDASDLAQAFVVALFAQFEEGLRELGAGDMGMSRRMKKMSEAFYGRLKAYGATTDETDLAEALVRNLYRGDATTVEPARALAKYAVAVRNRIAHHPPGETGPDFGPLPLKP